MRKGIIGFLFLLVISILFSCAIFRSPYKDGIWVDRKIQENKVRELASSSKDIIEFASKIYADPPRESSPEHFLAFAYGSKSRADFDFLETDIFKIFCQQKNGNLYAWSLNKYAGRFGSMLFACERNNDVDSILLYESKASMNTAFPYLSEARFGTKTYFQEFVRKRKLHGFRSSNGIITFPSSRIHFPSVPYQVISEDYSVSIDLKNNEKKPVEIHILNSYVLINGSKYYLNFKSPENSNKFSKLRLNPGQTIQDKIDFTIPSLTKIELDSMKYFIFQLDSIRCDNFTKINYYDQQKHAVKY